MLRILQDKKFERVGGVRVLEVGVRIVSATDKFLDGEIKRGGFREDQELRRRHGQGEARGGTAGAIRQLPDTPLSGFQKVLSSFRKAYLTSMVCTSSASNGLTR